MGKAKELTLGGLVLAILLFIGMCILIIWAFSSNGADTEVDRVIIGGASYLAILGFAFLLFIVVVVLIIVLIKLQK